LQTRIYDFEAFTMLYTRNDIRAIQGTLREEIQCTGHGLRSANEVSLKILPAPANSGISFLRRDVKISRALIPASWKNVFDTHPCTVLGNDYGVSISRVERVLAALRGCGVDNALIEVSGAEVPILDGSSAVLAALRGCGVDNALIEVSGAEVPILDGSSAPIVEMINRAGVIAQGVARHGIWIDHFVAVRSGEHYAFVKPANLPSITVDGIIAPGLHTPQQASFDLLDHVFEREIAPARRPGFDNSLSARRSSKTGYDIGQPRFDDELTRNRALECLGFLALSEAPIYGELYFYKPSTFLIDLLISELNAARDTWRRLSYVEIDRLSGFASQHHEHRFTQGEKSG
jgi:UDP-3-O-[3-hydroxymyristoyl] N-acetylglucosamine deacetylase